MSLKSFDCSNPKQYKKYIGKHCLFKKYSWEEYSKIYIMDIRDGIVRYTLSDDTVHYSDIIKFDGMYFMINPFFEEPEVLQNEYV